MDDEEQPSSYREYKPKKRQRRFCLCNMFNIGILSRVEECENDIDNSD